MPDIKTKPTGEKTIKSIDKAAIASKRMKDAFVRTKDKAEHGVYADDNSPDEYATDRVSERASNLTHKAAHQFDKQGRKGFDTTNQNIPKAKEYVQNRRNKANSNSSAKGGSSNASAKIKTLERNNNIKTSARSTGKTAFKKTDKGTIKTANKSVKTAEKTSKTAIKTTQQTAKAAQKTAQATAKSAQKATQAARATAKTAVQTTKAAVKATIATVKAIIAGTKALIAAIAAGGWVAVVAIIIICLIALLVGSCFGIFFSNEETPGGKPLTQVIEQLNTEYYNKIEQIKSESVYDDVEVISNDGVQAVKWNEVLAVFAVKTTTDSSGTDVVTITDKKTEVLRQILWDMNDITHSSKTVSKEADIVETDSKGNETTVKKIITEKILTIHLTHKTYTQMISEYSLNDSQSKQLTLLMSDDYNSLWVELLGGYSDGKGEIIISGADFIPTDIFSWALPESYTISSHFGYRSDPFSGKTKFHGGLDIAAPAGTPILAATDGIVTVANSTDSWGYGYGYHVKIQHNNIFDTLYAHCSSIAVTNGQSVKKGQVIAYVGTTGNSTGNHLHFEVYKDGERTNPLNYFTH